MPAKFSGKTPGEKLLALYTLLLIQDGKRISLTRLAQLLDCSKQTVLRLLNQMEASRFGKLEEPLRQGREHCYRLMPQPRQRLDIGPKEAAQLALCRSTLMRLLPKEALPPDDEAAAPSPAVHVVYKGYIDYERFTGQYAALLRAVEEQKVCRITYRRSPFREPRAFFFAPMRLISYRESLAAIGWEVTENGPAKPRYESPLLLYIQRCQSVSLTARGSKGLPEPGSNDAKAFGLLEDGEPFTVELLFEEDTAGYVHDRQWAADQRFELTSDRRLRLEMTARNPAETISWVLGFGDRVTVLSPDWLKEEVRRRALAVAEKYAPPT